MTLRLRVKRGTPNLSASFGNNQPDGRRQSANRISLITPIRYIHSRNDFLDDLHQLRRWLIRGCVGKGHSERPIALKNLNGVDVTNSWPLQSTRRERLSVRERQSGPAM